MTPDQRDELIDRLTVLAEYYEKPKSDAQITMYVSGLEDLPYPAVITALSQLVKTSTFYPKIAEIRALAEGDIVERADDGWRELHSEIRRVGSWRQPALSPEAHETMLLLCGSWERAVALIGRADQGPELQGWQKRWREAYGNTSGKIQRGELIGRDEAKQILGGIPKQFPGADERAVSAVPARISPARDVSNQGRRRDG